MMGKHSKNIWILVSDCLGDVLVGAPYLGFWQILYDVKISSCSDFKLDFIFGFLLKKCFLFSKIPSGTLPKLLKRIHNIVLLILKGWTYLFSRIQGLFRNWSHWNWIKRKTLLIVSSLRGIQKWSQIRNLSNLKFWLPIRFVQIPR